VHRSFHAVQPPFALLGEKQTLLLLKYLKTWAEDPEVDYVMVLSSVPLMWPSVPLALLAAAAEGSSRCPQRLALSSHLAATS
jgi:hypothetical protein